ncbi:unnamed protein product [marine sediment metagenome]|uniref:Uncharacterized protein n=1 Tax=marine sediment metagenome TaxID=412755 RepID=X1AAY1_9ZZZZ
MLHANLTEKIVKAFYKVNNTLGFITEKVINPSGFVFLHQASFLDTELQLLFISWYMGNP